MDSAPASETVKTPAPSNTMRTPLPPTSADADLLRQSERGSASPQFRIMPLPQTGGASVTIKTSGGSFSSPSSSGNSGGSGSSVTPATNPATKPAIPVPVQLAKTFVATTNIRSEE